MIAASWILSDYKVNVSLLFLGESVVSLVTRSDRKDWLICIWWEWWYKWYRVVWQDVYAFLWDGEKEKARELSLWNCTSFSLLFLRFNRGYDVTQLQKHCHRNNSGCANWRSHLRHGNNNPKKPKYYSLHDCYCIQSIWLILLNLFDST